MKHGVVIGRFQPFHYGHKHLVDAALAASDLVTVVVGSTGTRPDTKNPLAFEYVASLIRAAYEGTRAAGKIRIQKVEDEPYDDDLWAAKVREVVGLTDAQEITLFGHKKDASGYYQDFFPGWGYVATGPCPDYPDLSATAVRSLYYGWRKHLDESLRRFLPYKLELLDALMAPDLDRYVAEFKAIAAHKDEWTSAGAAKYGVQHVACDTLLLHDENVLLIERGGAIGNGSLALPGGFVNAGERIIDACFRELHEETGIDLRDEWRTRFAQRKAGLGYTVAFDYPWRSLTGRIFTNVLTWGLNEHVQPTPGDDAKRAFWVHRSELELLKPRFYGDHYHMIKQLLGGLH